MGWLGRRLAGWRLSRAQRLLAAGSRDAAIALLERIHADVPDAPGPRIHLALARAEASPETALPLLEGPEAAAAFHEPHIRALFRGIVLVQHGEYERATEALDEAIRGDPENRLARGYRALCWIATGRVADGVKALRDGGLAENFVFQRRLALLLERRLYLEPADAAAAAAAEAAEAQVAEAGETAPVPEATAEPDVGAA